MPSTSERPWLHEAPQYGLRMLAAVDPDNPAVLRFAAPAEALPEDTRVSVLWPDSWGGRDGTTGQSETDPRPTRDRDRPEIDPRPTDPRLTRASQHHTRRTQRA